MTEPTTVYNIPDRTSSDYALRQRAYDRAVAEGMWTPDGRLETTVSQATTVPNLVRQVPSWKVLFGLEIKTTIALFGYRPEWDTMRVRSIFEAPSLGGFQKRAADRQKISDLLDRMGSEPSAADQVAGLRIIAAIEATESSNRNILYARNQMGSVVAA